MPQRPLEQRILAFCIIASLSFHGLALFLLQRHSLWFKPTDQEAGQVAWDKVPRDEILKETFQSLSVAEKESGKETPLPKKEKTPEALCSPKMDTALADTASLLVFQMPPPFDARELMASNTAVRTFASLPLNPIELFPKGLILPTLSQPPIALSRFTLPPVHPEKPVVLEKKTPEPQSVSAEPTESPSAPSLEESALAHAETRQSAHLPSPMPSLPVFPTLDQLETTSYSDRFDVDLVFFEEPNSQDLLFALTLIPRSDLKLPKIRQHYSFLIDRSNSIQRERLSMTKNGVLKAISDLAEGDTFNVIAFDSKVEKLFPSNMPATANHRAKAKEFLEKIQLGSFFAPSDLYKPLLLTLPGLVQEDELHTAILLTDGEQFAKKASLRAVLENWTKQNQGKVALYTVGMGGDSQLPALETLCHLNRGRHYSSPTKRGLKRKLLKLMQTIHMPVAKNITFRAISPSPQTHIELVPQQAPHLYLDQPYVIVGRCDGMNDFILFVQGKMKDRWINIKKTVSFLSAKKGGDALRREWALLKSYDCYERFIQDNNVEHFAEARALLSPFDIPSVFQ